MKQYTRALAVFLLLIAFATAAHAGAGNREGTSGATELLIPVGTRDIAMGGSTIATTSGVDALFWNPASAAKMTNSVGLYVSHMSYIADIGVDYGAVSANFEGLGVLSLSIKSLAIGAIPVTTTQNPDGTGQMFTPQYFTVGISYGRRLSDRIAVGITTNIITERLGEVSANGVGFNVGVVYDNLGSVDGLSLGVTVKNIGPQMKFDGTGLLNQASVSGQNRPPQFYSVDAAGFELPSSIEFGLGYKKSFTGDNSFLLSSGFQSNNFSPDEYKLGIEYAYQDMFFLRGGYDFSQKDQLGGQYLFGAAFGAGVHTALGSVDVTFDYAYRAMKVFDSNHVFSLKLGF
jgi:hypothetical protein